MPYLIIVDPRDPHDLYFYWRAGCIFLRYFSPRVSKRIFGELTKRWLRPWVEDFILENVFFLTWLDMKSVIDADYKSILRRAVNLSQFILAFPVTWRSTQIFDGSLMFEVINTRGRIVCYSFVTCNKSFFSGNFIWSKRVVGLGGLWVSRVNDASYNAFFYSLSLYILLLWNLLGKIFRPLRTRIETFYWQDTIESEKGMMTTSESNILSRYWSSCWKCFYNNK